MVYPLPLLRVAPQWRDSKVQMAAAILATATAIRAKNAIPA
jgi:hypothetical protein